MRIAYVISRYPGVSHTFILREVLALRHLGLKIDTFSIRRALNTEILSAVDDAEARQTYNLLPPRIGHWTAAHIRALLRHPIGYVATFCRAMNMRLPGLRAALWQIFYFAEAILLWDQCQQRGIHHLHAHFANVAADVALLAVDFGNHQTKTRWSWSMTMHGPTEFYEIAQHHLPAKVTAANFIICISDFCRSQLMTQLPQEHWGKLRVVHCGIDTEQYAWVEREGRPSPDQGLTEILCVGRLVRVKGMAILLRAVEVLVQRGRNIHLTIIGEGPERAALATLIREQKIENYVSLVGAVGQDLIGEYFQKADIFCLPSFAEGVPVVLMEAMATGLPVVSTRIMGIPELIEQGKSGLLTAPGRVDQLVEALDALVGSKTLRHQMGRAGRAKVQQEFDLWKSARQLLEYFRYPPGSHLAQDEANEPLVSPSDSATLSSFAAGTGL